MVDSKRIYSLEEAQKKIEYYCAYQERCHLEVITKLKSFGLLPVSIDHLILKLIESNFLNEERYARAFVSGKFRIKKWGRIKITNKLKAKNISNKCIEIGLSEINEKEYMDLLNNIVEKKWSEKKSNQKEYQFKSQLARHLFSKGFENDLIWTAINTMDNRD